MEKTRWTRLSSHIALFDKYYLMGGVIFGVVMAVIVGAAAANGVPPEIAFSLLLLTGLFLAALASRTKHYRRRDMVSISDDGKLRRGTKIMSPESLISIRHESTLLYHVQALLHRLVLVYSDERNQTFEVKIFLYHPSVAAFGSILNEEEREALKQFVSAQPNLDENLEESLPTKFIGPVSKTLLGKQELCQVIDNSERLRK